MSSLMYISSNYPLEEIKNPHYKTLSANEALSLGMNIPEFMLEPGYDRDIPDVLLWSDTEILIDTASGTTDDGGLDDDFAIPKLNDTTDIYTVKKHHVYLEWICTEGRAEKVIEYVKNQLEHTDEIEIWHIWMGNEARSCIERRRLSMDDFTPAELMHLADLNVFSEPITQHCLIIRR